MHNQFSSQKKAFPLAGIRCRSTGGLALMKKGSIANATLWGHCSNLSHEQNQHIAVPQDNHTEITVDAGRLSLSELATYESFVGHRVTSTKSVGQPFGSMPRLSSSRRSSLLIQPALLSSPSSFIATANRSDRSTSRRSCTTCRSFWFSLVDIGVYRYILRFEVINVHHCIAFSKAKPGSVSPLTGPLTTNDKARIEVAMSDHITPLTGRNSLTPNKFTWRFLAISRSDRNAKPCRMSVEAHTEREARQVLAPHFILSLAARLPVQEVSHA